MMGLAAADRAMALLNVRRPNYRRQGLGRLMLAQTVHLARHKDHVRIVLSTSELQQAALRLYRSAGYQLIREEVAMAASNRTVSSSGPRASPLRSQSSALASVAVSRRRSLVPYAILSALKEAKEITLSRFPSA
jgi:ribosomal protein S18 acetylase RimI-like enzyme